MPELPEVETVVRELHSDILGEEIRSVNVSYAAAFRGESTFIVGKEIKRVFRRCKYIVFDFGNNCGILTHLRMTGKYVFNLSEKDEKHAHVALRLSSGKTLHYVDIRKFGGLEVTASLKTRLEEMGCEPLTETFNPQFLSAAIKNSKRTIKAILLDQAIVCGIGNIYADESLFFAGVHPQTEARKLTAKQVQALVLGIKDILARSINNMGTTLSDYRTTKNVGGENQNYLRVYGQDGLPCATCGEKVQKIKLGGRGTHFCRVCQPIA